MNTRVSVILVVLLLSLNNSSKSSEYTNMEAALKSPEEKIFSAYFDQISVLSGRFVHKSSEDQDEPATRTFIRDIVANRYIGTLITPEKLKDGRDCIMMWADNGISEWDATSAVYDLKHKGAMNVKISKSGEGILPKDIYRNVHRIEKLDKIFTPYHLRTNMALSFPSDLPVNITSIRTEGMLEKKYWIVQDGKEAWYIKYVLDDRDGIKVISCQEAEVKTSGTMEVSFSAEYGAHVKSNGVWVPRSVVETHHATSLTTGKNYNITEEFTFSEIVVNPEVNKLTFDFVIPYGSRVLNRITGVRYLQGYFDPDAVPGEDADVISRIEVPNTSALSNGDSKTNPAADADLQTRSGASSVDSAQVGSELAKSASPGRASIDSIAKYWVVALGAIAVIFVSGCILVARSRKSLTKRG